MRVSGNSKPLLQVLTLIRFDMICTVCILKHALDENRLNCKTNKTYFI